MRSIECQSFSLYCGTAIQYDMLQLCESRFCFTFVPANVGLVQVYWLLHCFYSQIHRVQKNVER